MISKMSQRTSLVKDTQAYSKYCKYNGSYIIGIYIY